MSLGENNRLVHDVINHVLMKGEKGLIMSADFEAALDSISWNFVKKVLGQYAFGPNFQNLIRTLYFNSENFSRIMLNGYLGDKIYLKNGIRQGDPASGYLFNLAVNILAQQIKSSPLLTGIRVAENVEIRITQYADDTVLFLENSSGFLEGALQELQTFSNASGLRMNIEKTSCMQIGAPNQQHIVNNYRLKWVSQMKILGIVFTNKNDNLAQNNFEPKVLTIKREIAQWRRRNLTPLGRITVIKSLLIAKLVHLFSFGLHSCQQCDVKP